MGWHLERRCPSDSVGRGLILFVFGCWFAEGSFPDHDAVLSAGDDEIATAETVHKRGFFVVAGESALARFGIVDLLGVVDGEAMAPAVLTVQVDRWTGGRSVGGGGCIGLVGITGGLTALEADSFGVCFIEVMFEVGNGAFSNWFLAPVADVMGEDARVLEVVDGAANDDGVGDWFITGGGEVLARFDLFPEVCEGLIGVPLAGEVAEVEFEVVGGEGAVGGAKVRENLEAG